MKRLALALCTLAAFATDARADAIDDLRDAISARLSLMTDVAKYKWNRILPVVDAEREAALVASATRDAVARGVPEPWARRVIEAQIAASRALQVAATEQWRAQQHAAFSGVPDLASAQRPAIDAATARLVEALAAARCALVAGDTESRLAASPAGLGASVWTIATAALWPTPHDGCAAP